MPAARAYDSGHWDAVDAHVADARALLFEPGSFDVVVSTSTLDHFSSRAEVGKRSGSSPACWRPAASRS
jgi:ubiquinone/menaquinone biosynthesis C-methylase UbiE